MLPKKKYPILVAVVLVTVFFSAVSRAAVDESLISLTQKLLQRVNLKEEVGKRVAVFRIINHADGKRYPLSVEIEEALVDALVNQGSYRVIEWHHLESIIKKWESHTGSSFTEAKAAELGKMAGAARVLIGSFRIQAETVKIKARLIDVDTKEIIGSGLERIVLTEDVRRLLESVSSERSSFISTSSVRPPPSVSTTSVPSTTSISRSTTSARIIPEGYKLITGKGLNAYVGPLKWGGSKDATLSQGYMYDAILENTTDVEVKLVKYIWYSGFWENVSVMKEKTIERWLRDSGYGRIPPKGKVPIKGGWKSNTARINANVTEMWEAKGQDGKTYKVSIEHR